MKTVTKIILIILTIMILVVIGAGIYAGITIKKGLDLKASIEAINITEMEETVAQIRDGNCSKLDEFEGDAEELRVQIVDACENTALKKIIEEQREGVCEMVSDPNSDAQKELNELREQCGLV